MKLQFAFCALFLLLASTLSAEANPFEGTGSGLLDVGFEDRRVSEEDSSGGVLYEAVVDVSSHLNVRAAPDGGAEDLGDLFSGDRVEVLEERGDWCRIRYGGAEDAWVGTAWIKRVDGVEAADEGVTETSGAGTQVRTSTILNVPVYDQNFSGGRYPDGYCGPVCVQMVMRYFGKHVDVDYLATTRFGERPLYDPGEGSNGETMVDVFHALGFPSAERLADRSIDWLAEQTRAGRPVIVSVMGRYHPDHRTSTGHFLVVVGVNDEGDVVVNDPNPGERIVCPKDEFHRAWTRRWRYGLVVSAP